MKVQAFAKLNLTLCVFPKCGQFHPVDSLATSVSLCDVVTVTPRTDGAVAVSCPSVPQHQNTAYKAACAFQKQFGGSGWDVFVQKNIPFGAGMGGSSADAAAVVHCLCKMHNVDETSPQINALCTQVGSDVAFMLRGGFCRMMGQGNVLWEGQNPPKLHFAVTVFNEQSSSAKVYAAFDNLPAPPPIGWDNETLFFQMQNGQLPKLDGTFNSLQPASAALSNYAKPYVDFCRTHNIACQMTGSGSAYFVACQTAEEAQCACELLRQNGFDTFTCHSVERGIIDLE